MLGTEVSHCVRSCVAIITDLYLIGDYVMLCIAMEMVDFVVTW